MRKFEEIDDPRAVALRVATKAYPGWKAKSVWKRLDDRYEVYMESGLDNGQTKRVQVRDGQVLREV